MPSSPEPLSDERARLRYYAAGVHAMSILENLVIATIGGMVAWMGIFLFRNRRRLARWEVAEVLVKGEGYWWGRPNGLHLAFLTAVALPFNVIATVLFVSVLWARAIVGDGALWERLVIGTFSALWIAVLLAMDIGLFNAWNEFLLSKEAGRGERALCSVREWHFVFFALVGMTVGVAMVAYGLSAILAR